MGAPWPLFCHCRLRSKATSISRSDGEAVEPSYDLADAGLGEPNLAERTPIGWRYMLHEASLHVPHSFALKAYDFVLKMDLSSHTRAPITWFELTVMAVLSGLFDPSCQTRGDGAHIRLLHSVQTAVAQIRLIRQSVQPILTLFGLMDLIVGAVSSGLMSFARDFSWGVEHALLHGAGM